MSAERDAGFSALQRGDTLTAIDQLERAYQADPSDFQALTFLGAAYGQANRHADAVTALTNAVHLQPSNGQARYNLAVALKNGGWPDQALAAAQQALQLQPDYQRAHDFIQTLQPAAPAPPAYPAQPEPAIGGYAQPATLYAQPAQPQYGQMPGASMPGAAPAYSAPPPTQPGYAPQAYTPQGAAAYGGPPQRAPAFVSSDVTFYEDSFNPIAAFADWGRAIAMPGKFFRQQGGREGMQAPLALFFDYFLVMSLVTVLIAATGHSPATHVAEAGGFGYIPFLLIGMAMMAVAALIGQLILAGILNVVSGWFGGTKTYSGTFRAIVYSSAPYFLLAPLCSILVAATATSTPALPGRMPGAVIVQAQYRPGGAGQQGNPTFGGAGGGMPQGAYPGQPGAFGQPGAYGQPGALGGINPLAMLLSNPLQLLFLGTSLIWSIVLLCVGTAHVQGISGGAAVGAVVITGIIGLVILVGIFFIIGVLGAAALMGATRGH